jgi:hexosaminidase
MLPQAGRFQLKSGTPVVTADCSDEVKTIAADFAARIAATSNIELSMDATADAKAIRFETVAGMEKEAYTLSVTPTGVLLQASEPNGFFYGVQTLYQLLPAEVYGNAVVATAEWSIPAVEIDDAPRFAYRGMHIDPCRHFADVAYVKRYIDLLAMHKQNTLHFHLTDDQGWRIEIKKYPKLTEIGAKRKQTLVGYYYERWPQEFDGKEYGPYFYTQEEIKDIVAYAAARYITVIPEIEMPGHAVAALAAYPELSCDPSVKYEVEGRWGIFPEVFCPSETTFKFLEGVIDEVIELFPSELIHVGGDECPKDAWKSSAFCQQLIRKLGLKDDTEPNPADGRKHSKEDKLQSYFITRMEKYINSKGRNIIGWDEILEGGLAPNATVMSWRGTEGGITAARLGHDAIMTPTMYAYLDYTQENPEIAPIGIGGYVPLKRVYTYNPVPADADELVKKHIIGVQGNVWAEYITDDARRDYYTYPRAFAIAESGWTQDENKNFDDFCRRLAGNFERLDILDVKACRNLFDVIVDTHADEAHRLSVYLYAYYPDAEVRYTTDGTEPTAQSTLFTEPFLLEGTKNLKVALFKEGKQLGKTTVKSLYGNLVSGKPYKATPGIGYEKGDIFSPNEERGADPLTFGLTNGKRGYASATIPWTSFNTGGQNDELVLSFDLEQTTAVQRVVFGSYYMPALRVLPPSAVNIEVSTDGETYQLVKTDALTHTPQGNSRQAFTDTVTFEPTQARYVRMRLKNGGTLRNGIDFRFNAAVGKQGAPGRTSVYLDEVEIY